MTADTTLRSAVNVTGLRKSFGNKIVLDGVDLTVNEGTVFALLGPNGSGKTTIVRILSTLITADSGEMRVVAGRHPVIEQLAEREATRFIPNDLYFDAESEFIAVITGPTMGVK